MQLLCYFESHDSESCFVDLQKKDATQIKTIQDFY
jgi:hypothetical protein